VKTVEEGIRRFPANSCMKSRPCYVLALQEDNHEKNRIGPTRIIAD